MDRTNEFLVEIKRFNPPILSKPKKSRIAKLKEINTKLHKFKAYINSIWKAFLNISFTIENTDLDLPSSRLVFEMSLNQKNAFYLQLQNRIKEIHLEIKNANCDCLINGEIKESLFYQLNEISELLKSMEIKSKGSAKPTSGPNIMNTNASINDSLKYVDYESDEEMDGEMQQLLEQENQQLIQEYQQSLNQIEQANQKIQEIVQMQQELNLHLNTQLETSKTIQVDAEIIENNISSGVAVLKRTKEIFGGSRYWVFYFFITCSLILLVIDYII
ncbi:hypothetical protein HDV01_003904 [Terramyces sp. JEL0728]|nr:hypothetical protein HDV01_003904 [Terramyces sp. JEL0728]